MEIKNKFLSIVTLGSFNPSILTPIFLNEQNIWQPDDSTKGKTTPVASELNFKDVSFFTELERFQASHHNPDDFKDSPIVEAVYKYLDVLKYTPVFIQGVNFNLNLTNYHSNKIIEAVFSDPETEFFKLIEGVEAFQFDIKSKVNKEYKEITSFNCKYYIDVKKTVSINIRKLDDLITLNYNYEVEEIDKDRKRLNFIYENYIDIYGMFLSFLNKIKE